MAHTDAKQADISRTGTAEPVLSIRDLHVRFRTGDGILHAVKGIDVDVSPGETVAIVGESGSGKSQTMMSVMGLLASNGWAEGSVKYRGEELVGLSPGRLNAYRGSKLTMIFQEPMTSLDPLYRIGDQLALPLTVHGGLSGGDARKRAIELLELVRIPDPARRIDAYPHELSGGQRQRVMIAMALALEPKLLIADEPTTALDVTTQAQVLKLIDNLRRKMGTAVLFITHDFGVVAEIADRVAVLQQGELVEEGTVEEVLTRPQHAYTKRLLAAVPSLTPPAPKQLAGEPIALKVHDLTKTYGGRGFFRKGREVHAADAVSFDIRRGETLGLVGESGSGKSTVGRCVLRLIEPDGGAITIGDLPFGTLPQRDLRPHRRKIQMVFQDPFASLNPRRTVGRIISEGPVTQGTDPAKALDDARILLEKVGLPVQAIERYPHEFSGGQRQRIGIARALAMRPDVLVADEAVSALDVSVQAEILKLLKGLQEEFGLAILFITHDLRVAAQICDRVAVMQKGRIVEMAETAQLFAHPRDAYTRQLLAAVPGMHTMI